MFCNTHIGPQIEFLENMSDASDADSCSDRGSDNGTHGCSGSDSTESSHSTSVSEEAECGRQIECVGSLFSGWCLFVSSVQLVRGFLCLHFIVLFNSRIILYTKLFIQ